MKTRLLLLIGLIGLTGVVSGCAMLNHALCAPNCKSQTHNSSSLVSFLYPDGKVPPAENAIAELHVPLRVGLAFLPSQSSFGDAQLDDAHKLLALGVNSPTLQKEIGKKLALKFLCDSRQEVKDRVAAEIDGA